MNTDLRPPAVIRLTADPEIEDWSLEILPASSLKARFSISIGGGSPGPGQRYLLRSVDFYDSSPEPVLFWSVSVQKIVQVGDTVTLETDEATAAVLINAFSDVIRDELGG